MSTFALIKLHDQLFQCQCWKQRVTLESPNKVAAPWTEMLGKNKKTKITSSTFYRINLRFLS